MDTKFYGTVKNGNLVLDNEQAYEAHLMTLDGEVEVITRKRKRTRSLKQNDYYWGVVIQKISEYTGHSAQEVHELMKNLFLRDMLIVNKDIYRSTKSTTELSTKQFIDYIQKINLWALDRLDVNIPEPEDVYE